MKTRKPAIALAALVAAGLHPVPAMADAQDEMMLSMPESGQSTAPTEAIAVIEFWRTAGPNLWFAKDGEFDRRFRDRFLTTHEAATRGELPDWADTVEGSLALVLLLDQFPRNAFRGTPRMYATDGMAREYARTAVDRAYDFRVEHRLALFFYLPFAHSEDPSDQERSVSLAQRLGEPDVIHAKRHRDIILRFGRFPHRNAILGRPMRDDEQRYLDAGGYAG